MGVVAGEAAFPRRDLPRARVNLFIRTLVIYLSTGIFISVLVPYTEPLLLSTSNLASSPFVIAMKYAGNRILPDIVNVVLLICLCGIGSEELFMALGVQVTMAGMGVMSPIFKRINSKGRSVTHTKSGFGLRSQTTCSSPQSLPSSALSGLRLIRLGMHTPAFSPPTSSRSCCVSHCLYSRTLRASYFIGRSPRIQRPPI